MLMQEILDACVPPAPPAWARTWSGEPMPLRPTDKQLAFYTTLVEGKEMTDDQRNRLRRDKSFLTKRTISGAIQDLTALPWNSITRPLWSSRLRNR